MKIREIFVKSILILMGIMLIFGCSNNNKYFTNLSYGKIKQYHKQKGKMRTDLSGAVVIGDKIILVDDGGKPSDYNLIRVINSDQLEAGTTIGKELNTPHRDLEGATHLGQELVITTSLSKEKKEAYCLTTKYKFNSKNGDISKPQTINLRDNILSALKSNFNKDWYSRISKAKSKNGGLNIEGISYNPKDKNSLIYGLRSPLLHDDFAKSKLGKKGLSKGKAILAYVKSPFVKPSILLKTIDLQGQGIRGMEYIPALKGVVIIAGPAYKADGYQLWLLKDNGLLEKLTLKGFSKLCRPESVISYSLNKKNYLVVFSEESGNACKGCQFTYIQAEIKQ